MAEPPSRRTRSARATSTRAVGVATQSKFLAVGSVVPWAAPHVGAIATQSYANPRYGPDGLALLREGLSAEEVVERLTAADDDRAVRQLGVVDGEGARRRSPAPSATPGRAAGRATGTPRRATSSSRRDGRRPRRDVRGDRRDASPSGCSTASTRRRPRAATAAAGSRRRCSSSSATAATPASPTRSSTFASTTTPTARRAAAAPRDPRRPVRQDAARGVDRGRRRAARGARRAARAVGHARLADWAGVENLEERVDGEDEIDPVVLARLREVR